MSFWCGLFALGVPILLLSSSMHILMLWMFFPSVRKMGSFLEPFMFIVPYLLVAIALVALVSGVISLIIIHLEKGILKGTNKAVIGVVLSLVFFLFVFGMPQLAAIRHLALKQMCQNNLLEIGKALRQYATDNNKYPTDYNWCDLLIEHNSLKEEIFWCGGADENRLKYKNSNYALNSSAEPNSPPNLVLVCETKYGWNQLADPNLLTAENHMNKGSNILFNDGHVEFIKKKNFKNLIWKSREADNR
jgi:prepilin-type processing-associated H-X9-DG protein